MTPEELIEQILNDAQKLRGKISELGNSDYPDSLNISHYTKLIDALCDFIGDY